MGTTLLPIPLTSGQRPKATLASVGPTGRHRANRVEQVTQGVQPLGGRTGSVQQDLPVDGPHERVFSRRHTRQAYPIRTQHAKRIGSDEEKVEKGMGNGGKSTHCRGWVARVHGHASHGGFDSSSPVHHQQTMQNLIIDRQVVGEVGHRRQPSTSGGSQLLDKDDPAIQTECSGYQDNFVGKIPASLKTREHVRAIARKSCP